MIESYLGWEVCLVDISIGWEMKSVCFVNSLPDYHLVIGNEPRLLYDWESDERHGIWELELIVK